MEKIRKQVLKKVSKDLNASFDVATFQVNTRHDFDAVAAAGGNPYYNEVS